MKLAERLQSGGFTPEQAKTAASALAEAVSASELATKQDLELTKRDLKIRFGSIMIVAVGVILAAIRYLPPHP